MEKFFHKKSNHRVIPKYNKDFIINFEDDMKVG